MKTEQILLIIAVLLGIWCAEGYAPKEYLVGALAQDAHRQGYYSVYSHCGFPCSGLSEDDVREVEKEISEVVGMKAVVIAISRLK